MPARKGAKAAPTETEPQELAAPLRAPGDLDPLIDRIGEARVVCIGEASHGTHEYYEWRAQLTRRLIEERAFDLVAVEGDWPDCHAVHCCVTGSESAPEDPLEVLTGFDRWPTWMWANQEVVDFTRWLRKHNLTRGQDERVGFYGLDVYSLWESLRAVLDHLREHHPLHVDAALEACRCLEPYAEDPQAYARATRVVPASCELEVVSMLSSLNVGQLVRERYGERDSVLVGFGTHHGSVVAAQGWGEPTRRMTVPPARRGSTEALLHDGVGAGSALFVFPEKLPRWAAEERSHRAIGVVYRPDAERWGNYVPTILGRRYDAFLWFDETSGLRPLHGVRAHGEEQETWPYGR
jgi:erythromycin esterase-like protein